MGLAIPRIYIMKPYLSFELKPLLDVLHVNVQLYAFALFQYNMRVSQLQFHFSHIAGYNIRC